LVRLTPLTPRSATGLELTLRAYVSLHLCCGCWWQRAVAGDPSTTAFFHRIQQAIKAGLLDVTEQTASCLLTIDALNVSGLQLTLPMVGLWGG